MIWLLYMPSFSLRNLFLELHLFLYECVFKYSQVHLFARIGVPRARSTRFRANEWTGTISRCPRDLGQGHRCRWPPYGSWLSGSVAPWFDPSISLCPLSLVAFASTSRTLLVEFPVPRTHMQTPRIVTYKKVSRLSTELCGLAIDGIDAVDGSQLFS